MKKDNPLVSIIIPVYNREKYINHAIESAINQTYKNIEIIIGDNNSTDNTWNILKEWERKDNRIKIFQNTTNVGPVLNWKKCFERAKGDYIKILWSDDWMDFDFIEKSLPLLKSDVAFVISNHIIINDEDKKNIYQSKYHKNEYSTKFYLCNILGLHYVNYPVSPGCAIFRKKDIIESFILDIPNGDGLDSKKNGAGNDLLMFLITASRYKKVCISNCNSYFRSHNESFSVASPILIYYEWAKLYFVQNYDSHLYQSIMKYRYYIDRRTDKVLSNIIYSRLKFSLKDIFEIIVLKLQAILRYV